MNVSKSKSDNQLNLLAHGRFSTPSARLATVNNIWFIKSISISTTHKNRTFNVI